MRIAITTDDLERIDAGFGLARHIAIYEVTAARTRRLAVHRFPARPPGCGRGALDARTAALKNCGLLCTLEIGEPGAARAASMGAAVLRVERPRPIAEVLATLRGELGGARPWLRARLRTCPERERARAARRQAS